ncbi:MAG: A24 family peptidase [Planctomycetota bacterium]
MIAFWVDLPIVVRDVLLFILGGIAGGLANSEIYTAGWFRARPISPWSPPDQNAPPRSRWDRVPIVGWLGLRRERAIHGKGFWVRPLLVEFSLAIGFVALHHFETLGGGLLPIGFRENAAFMTAYEPYATPMLAAHLLLLVFMTAATFIDFDEQTIPDIITVPGTLLGLTLATLTPKIFAPTIAIVPGTNPPMKQPFPTTFDAPGFGFLGGPWSGSTGLLLGLLIWWTWCFALADRRFRMVIWRRRGLRRACRHFVDGLFHHPGWKILLTMAVLGSLALLAIHRVGGDTWHGCLTSLVGLAVGGGVVWAIRIVASGALGLEAMGFGDVTLMAMIGTFVGWQAAILAFFLSPFTAIIIVVVRLVLSGQRQTPFGPYLCAGTLLTLVFWDALYQGQFKLSVAILGPFLLWLAISMLVLMTVLLYGYRLAKERFLYRDETA